MLLVCPSGRQGCPLHLESQGLHSLKWDYFPNSCSLKQQKELSTVPLSGQTITQGRTGSRTQGGILAASLHLGGGRAGWEVYWWQAPLPFPMLSLTLKGPCLILLGRCLHLSQALRCYLPNAIHIIISHSF